MGRVIVRDATTPSVVSIQIAIFDGWPRALGPRGLSLYLYYAFLAATRSAVGERQIATALGMSRSAVRQNTALLNAVGLIEFVPGDNIRPNVINVVDVPPYDAAAITAALNEIESPFFRSAVEKRTKTPTPPTPARAQRLPAVPHPTTQQNDQNTIIINRLLKIGFTKPAAWLPSVDNSLVAAWLDAFDAGEYNDVKNRAGLLRRAVENSEQPTITGSGCKRCGAVVTGSGSYCSSCIDELGIIH